MDTNFQKHYSFILEHLKLFTKSNKFKILEDPLEKTMVIRCCKDEPEIPIAVWNFVKTCNPHDVENHKFVMETLVYFCKHQHTNPFPSTLGMLQISMFGEKTLSICRNCFKHNPVLLDGTWLHVCKNSEWAIAAPGRKPTMRWHQAANCWVFSYSFHNKIHELLSKQKDVSFDIKNNVWLVGDNVSSIVAANIKQWAPDFVWLQNTKRTAPPSRARISTSALHAETILSFLPKEELKTLTRKVFMSLHPDKGGKHDDFIKFKLALEGWEKGQQK